MPHMIYDDYRKVALKHLKTCEFMIQNLHNLSDNDVLDGLTKSEWKSHVLRNVYYLCGYAIEGIVNYCIYKKLSYSLTDNIEDVEIHDLRALYPRANFPRNKGFCYNWRRQGYYGVSYYSISNHNFQENIKMLRYISPTKFNKIPVISSPKNTSNIESLRFYDWNVSTRYQTDDTNYQPISPVTLNEDEILNFFIFVRDELYSKLPTL